MKYLSLLIAVAAIAVSCNKAGKQLKERIVNSDSIAINFFKGDGTMDTVEAVRIIRDRKTIDELTNAVTESGKSLAGKCGVDGSLHFFKMNQVIQDVDFSLKEEGGCNQFIFLQSGHYNATAVGTEAGEILRQLKAK